MDNLIEQIIKKENCDSIELNLMAKGNITWSIKVYGDTKTPEGLFDLTERTKALKEKAISLSSSQVLNG